MLIENLGNINIVEVGPRDGLQNEKNIVSTGDKLHYIELLAKSGLKSIEPTSFVKPSAIAQMADARELYSKIDKKIKDSINLPCLVPNMKGMETAVSVGVKEIAIFTATSEEFNKRNINATIQESFKRLEEVVKVASAEKIRVRGYVSTAFGCPYSGEIGVQKLIEVSQKLLDLGAYEVSIGDTIGIANPLQVETYLNKMLKSIKAEKLAMHFHDTRAMALMNIFVSYKMGIRTFDASSGGLGGCPYAKGASGNVTTEEVVNFFESSGVSTGVDMAKLVDASKFILTKLGKNSESKFFRAYISTGK